MMPTPFVLNDAVVIKQKIIPGQITRAPIPIVTQNQPLLKNVQFSEEGLLKSKDNTKFPKICEAAAPIIQKEQRRIIIANDRVKTQ
jgi:hypothetical protein